jgi:hypothetical protein
MREDGAGVREQPAPVAGVVAALAQLYDQVEVERPARAEEQGRLRGLEAGAVGGDEDIGGEPCPMQGAKLP